MTECVFCRIADGTIQAPRLYEDADVVAFPDAQPKAPFHALVIPRAHKSSLLDFEDGETDGLGKLLRAALTVARGAGLDAPERGFRIVANTGPHGGQSVFHVHLHVLGGRPLAWPPG